VLGEQGRQEGERRLVALSHQVGAVLVVALFHLAVAVQLAGCGHQVAVEQVVALFHLAVAVQLAGCGHQVAVEQVVAPSLLAVVVQVAVTQGPRCVYLAVVVAQAALHAPQELAVEVLQALL
jgi:hypothetical protein